MSSPTSLSRRLMFSAAVLALTGVLAACASSDQSSEPNTSTSSESKLGGVAVIAVNNAVTCLDPQQGTAFVELMAVQHAVDQLTHQDPETGELEPWLATDWIVDDESTQFTFVVRDGVTFSDGTKLTAAVVARNIEEIRALGAGAPTGSSALAGLKEVVVDGDQVTFAFDQPNAQFLQATSTTALGILSEASYDTSAEERCRGEYSGTGPFIVSSFAPDSEITLERRTGYDWAPASTSHSGDALLDKIEFRLVPEPGVRTGLLTSHQVDAIGDVFREDESTFTKDGYWLQSRAIPGFTNSSIVNGRSEILSDPVVREALQIAIDRQDIVNTIASSTAVPATGLLSSTAPYASDFSSLLTLDVVRSKQLLDLAGWVPGEDGVREKLGTRLSLTVVHFGAQSELIALLNQQLNVVGAELVSKVMDPADRVAVEKAGDFDLIQRNLTRADPDVLRNQLGFDFSNYLYEDAPTALDDLLAAQASTTNSESRQQIVDQIQKNVLGANLVWPAAEITQVFAGSESLQGATIDASSRLNLYTAWKQD